MRHINSYTIEDVLSLNSMVDVLKYNVYNYWSLDVKTIDSIGIWRLCSTEEIFDVPIASTIYKFICFLEPSPCSMNIPLTKLIYKEYLENVPLYINKTKSLGLIAQWRLRIGK
jgi:hypothetical protein